MNAPTEYSIQLVSCFLEQPDRHCAAQLHKVQIDSRELPDAGVCSQKFSSACSWGVILEKAAPRESQVKWIVSMYVSMYSCI